MAVIASSPTLILGLEWDNGNENGNIIGYIGVILGL